jgi:hypothetical protein
MKSIILPLLFVAV